MNEKIKELAEKAGGFQLYPDRDLGDDKSFGFRERAMEKFAELIINECFEVVIKDVRFNDAKGILRGAGALAKQHFGVEQ
jgi:hypothetical protein